MHTTQTTHHRIFFSNVTNRTLLEELAENLGMEVTEDVDVFDLIQSEGESTIVCDALSDTFPERLLKVGCRDAYDMVFDEVITAYKKMAEDQNTQLISRLFEVSRYQTSVNDTDIDCDELFDLLSVLGDSHFKVTGIYTQWAMSSNKNQFGAHAGGTVITTQHFCVPCLVPPERADTVIQTLAAHTPDQMGDYFVNEFINPIMDGIKNEALRLAAAPAFNRFMQTPAITPADVKGMLERHFLPGADIDKMASDVRLKDEFIFFQDPSVTSDGDDEARIGTYYTDAIKGAFAPAKPIGQTHFTSGCCTDDEEIWAIWNGISEGDFHSSMWIWPDDLEAQVAEINLKLNRVDELGQTLLFAGFTRAETLWMIHQDIRPSDITGGTDLTAAGPVGPIAKRVESLLLRRLDLLNKEG